MTLTPEQTALVTRAKALVDANPNDHTSTMELVRGLVGIVDKLNGHSNILGTILQDIYMDGFDIGQGLAYNPDDAYSRGAARIVDRLYDRVRPFELEMQEMSDDETVTPAAR